MAGFPSGLLQSPLLANILTGYQTLAASGGPTTIITIPAGRTWQGVIGVSCSCAEDAAGAVRAQALGVIAFAGAGATPAAGNYMAVQAICGANAATGLVGDDATNQQVLPFTIAAPAANAVTVTITATIAGSVGRVDATAVGLLF